MRRQEPLLRKAAWLEGWIFTVSSLACLLLANRSATFAVLLALPGYAVVLAGYYFLSRSPSWFWVTAISTASIGTSILISLSEVSDPAISTAVLPLVGNGLAALSIMLHETTSGRVYLVLLFLATLGFTLPLQTPEGAVQLAAIILVAWVVNIGGAIWLSAAITSARARIARIGIAHQAERRASELEANRRRSARLLHDTVLATLTLLAHSGVGVDPQALRVQAAQDAILLRQLRLGETPSPRSSGTYMLQPDEVTAAAQSVRALRQRFARRGLTVHWHGDGDIILPHATRTAFMLSLGECLENVSRHAGVDAADVTVTQNEIGVRAMVTDAGVGFDTNDVDTARLGIAESVMARIRDVGGNARIFSAPGAGTTVVMEVPR